MSAPLRPGRTDLLVFGFVLPAVFGILGLVAWRRFDLLVPARTLWALGVVLTLLYAAVRALRQPMYEAWMTATRPIATVVSTVLIGVVFFGVVTPMGLVGRLIGRDLMGRRREPQRESYWTPHRCGDDPGRYLRQS